MRLLKSQLVAMFFSKRNPGSDREECKSSAKIKAVPGCHQQSKYFAKQSYVFMTTKTGAKMTYK